MMRRCLGNDNLRIRLTMCVLQYLWHQFGDQPQRPHGLFCLSSLSSSPQIRADKGPSEFRDHSPVVAPSTSSGYIETMYSNADSGLDGFECPTCLPVSLYTFPNAHYAFDTCRGRCGLGVVPS